MAVLFQEAVYLTGIFLIFGTIGKLEMTEGAVTRRGASSHCPDEKPYMESGQCTPECSPGLYGDDVTKMCEACDESCKTCLGREDRCTSCRDPLYLLDNKCEENCGSLLSRGPARGRVRLTGGRNDFEGLVQVLHDGVFGTICDDVWNMNAARVICRELQLGDALEATNAADAGFSPVSLLTPILLDGITCRGDESNIQSCSHGNWYTSACGHFEDAGVRCSGPDVTRLCVSECGDGFYQVPGTLECQLCDATCKTCSERSDNCQTCDAPRFLRSNQCLEDCGFAYYGNIRTRTCQACSPYCKNCMDGDTNDVCSSCLDGTLLQNGRCVSFCTEPLLSKHLPIRLVDGATPFEGRVEVYINGDWGTVCDDQFEIHDAEVVCRQLGFGEAVAAVRSPGFGPGQGKILMDDLRCNGTENELINCAQSPFSQNNCNHHEDAGVQCSGTLSIVLKYGSSTRTIVHPGATGACVDSCEGGYYASGPQCLSCDANCLDCADASNLCTACKAPSFLQGSSCISECGVGQFGNTLTSRCEACDRDVCDSCADGDRSDICTSCPQGRYMKDSECVLSCGPDKFLQDNTCVDDCGIGNYSNPNMFACEPCEAQCLSCGYVDTTNVQCITCKPPKILDTTSGDCVVQCPAGQFASIIDPSSIMPGQTIRLVGGHSHLQGRVEVLHDNQWGTICGDFFDKNAANITCQSLGLGNAVGLLKVGPGSGIPPSDGLIWLDNLLCDGTENRLEDCLHTEWGKHNCDHDQDAAIQCSGPGLRECTSECPLGFYTSQSDRSCQPCRVHCQTCQQAISSDYSCSACKPGTHLLGMDCVEDCGPGHFTSGGVCVPCSDNCVSCEGDSTHCTSCAGSKFLEGTTCVDTCNDYKLEKTNVIRLVGGSTPLEGRVEVKVGGVYGTVCDDEWDILDAQVVCRQLGLGVALEASIEAKFGSGQDIIALDNLACTGQETNLLACPHAPENDCTHREDAGVVCSGPDVSNTCISASQCNNGKYVTADAMSCGVCDVNCATCSQTSTHCSTCPTGRVLRGDSTCAEECEEGSYSDEENQCQKCSEQCLECTGHASQCTKCPPFYYMNTETQSCDSSCTDGLVMRGNPNIRLSQGQTALEGRVEILHNNQWGTVCDDDFDLLDAQVVCRQLDLGDALNFYLGSAPGSGPIWLDELKCTGEEGSLLECMHSGIQGHDCTHNEDVGVRCAGPDTSLKCVSSCDDGFFANSNSECEMCSDACLTCDGAADTCTSCSAPTFLNGTLCVESCPRGEYGNIHSHTCEPCHDACDECFDGQTNDMCKTCKPDFFLKGWSCVSSCSDGSQPLREVLLLLGQSEPVRLVGGANSREGRVEISHGDQWGTVCNNNWDLVDANVVCHQLGQGSAVEIITGSVFGQASSDAPIWLTGVDCKGWELGLSQCVNSGWGNTGCSHYRDVAIRCSGVNDQQRGNICRQVTSSSCDSVPCSSGVDCVTVSDDQSVCLECPEGQVGNGIYCTVVSSYPPTFAEEPKNRTINAGSGALFRCKADGRPTPRVTVSSWLKDGQPLSQRDLSSGRLRVYTSSGSLQFVRTRREDSGNYTCVIRNTQGVNTSSAFLVVKERPHIMSTHPDTRILGETAELGCIVVGLPESTVSWRRNGQPLMGERFQSFGENGTLLIRDVRLEDNGMYECVAVNQLGEDQASVKLTVYEVPTFLEGPQEMEVRTGSDVSIPCVVSGVPLPEITWKKDGQMISLNGRVTILEDNTLVIHKSQREDMGEYACIASNKVQTSARIAKLLIIGPPHITEAPTNQTRVTGETVVLPCTVIGAYNPVVTWQHNGEDVVNDERHLMVDDSLTVTDVDPADGGLYVCTATNTEGAVSANAYVSITGPVRLGQHKHVGSHTTLIVILIIAFIIIVAVVALYVRRRRNLGKKTITANTIFKGAPNPQNIVFSNDGHYCQFDNDADYESSGEEVKKSKSKLKFSPKKRKQGILLEEELEEQL
ncbi:scavenger receptor cysteine-rich type 1 protein M160 isoform X1 [Strongylocentrotus purpuratus]|uniref:Deleted in malignant brain tumors 1 protein-like n=1 Tax=Strongylocentrotus purpuratus TaxID=7668 RepID=A0A7M7N7J4_STRPU|nr:scavenger receptor cysteine-rich type 1 protein M160 isoform X1 [Strongylocentrotus purpuratus]